MIEDQQLKNNSKRDWLKLLNKPLSLPLKLRGRRWGLWLVMLFFFLLPWQTRYIFRAMLLYEYGTISVFAVEILAWVVIVLGVVRYAKDSPLRSQRTVLLMFVFAFFAFFSILWAPDKLIALQAAMRLLEGMLLFVVIGQMSNVKGQMFAVAFLVGAIIQALLGAYQFLTQSSFASTFLGMALHDPRALGTVVVEFADQRWLRAYGSLPHPNVLGGYLAVALAVLLISYKRLQEVTRGYKRLLGFGSVIVLLTGIFFSFSRSAWIVAIALLSYWVIKLLKSDMPWKKTYILLATFYILFLALLFRPLVAARIIPTSAERLEIKSKVERVEGIKESWGLIKKHPMLGVGIGNYTQAVQRDIRFGDPLYTYQPVHNVFLLIWAELGVVGLVLFLLTLYRIFKQSKSNVFMLLCFFVLMTLDHYFWTLPVGIFLFWGVLGLSTIMLQNKGT